MRDDQRHSLTMVAAILAGAKHLALHRASRKTAALAVLLTIFATGPSSAQLSAANPIFQGQKPGYQTTIDPSGAMIMRLRDNFGRPCISIRGFVRRNQLLPDVIDHMIEASNSCAKLITIKVCYFKTQFCKEMRMNSFLKKFEQLGSMNNVVYFQYSFTEKTR